MPETDRLKNLARNKTGVTDLELKNNVSKNIG